MKDLSFFLLKNSFGSKMKKGFRNLCNGETSTSTLDQHHPSAPRETHPTLEEMILQLELEERRGGVVQHRMSCVDSSDILRSARNALNQYPRFSLDGKDAMYTCSFTELRAAERAPRLPSMVGGVSVVWCKPGVVGKLMGLDAMPVPLTTTRKGGRRRIEPRRLARGVVGSCSRTGYCVVKKPVELDIVPSGEIVWPVRHFL